MSAQPQESGTRAVVKAPNVRMLETLDKMKAQISAALPRHIKPEFLIRVIVTTCNKNPKLYEAFSSNPASFLGAVMECSQLGLVPDGVLGMAYLIPYKNNRSGKLDTQVQIGYKGLMDLAYRSGKVYFVTGQTVRERDEFEYDLAQMTIRHKPAEKDRGEATHYYAVARVEGVPFPIFAVLSKSDALEHRARFASDKREDKSVWWSHFDAMAEKTCVRELCKWLPRSTEIDGGRIQRAAALDELAEAAVPQELITIDGVVIDDDDGGAGNEKAPDPTARPSRRGSAALKEELARKEGISHSPPETTPSAPAPTSSPEPATVRPAATEGASGKGDLLDDV